MRYGVFMKDKVFNPSVVVEADYFEKKDNGDLVFIVCDPETGFENEVGLILDHEWYAVKALAPIKPASEEEKNEDQP